MNFTYLYKDDPDMDLLYGNITWIVPNVEIPAHWIHAEYICTHFSTHFFARFTNNRYQH